MTNDFTRLEFEEFLDRVASRTLSPGGGAVAAAVGALSCALARMVAAYSTTKDLDEAGRARIEQLAGRLRVADELMRALVTQDAEAYERFAKAERDRKTGASSAVESEYQEALLAAIAVPMQVVGLAASALSTLSELRPHANRFLLCDLGAAAVLAEAAALAASYMVRVNAQPVADPERRRKVLSDLDFMLARCRAQAEALRATLAVDA